MTDSLKAFISQNEKEQKKFLTYYNVGDAIYTYGENSLNMDYYEGTGMDKCRLSFRIFLLVMLIFITDRILIGIAVYIGIHLLIRKAGEKISITYQQKLEKIQSVCQRSLDEFRKMSYEQNGILSGEKGDEIRFANNLVVREDSFEAAIQSAISPMHIYCLQNSGKKHWLDTEIEECINMKKNIASTEFNKKFLVFIPEELEKECMKFLSPARQVEMVRTSAFDRLCDIHIENGRITGELKDSYSRPDRTIDIYKYQLIGKFFSEVEEYCHNMKEMADNIQNSYTQITNIVTK